ncbi:MAG: Gfo/Idh/MocA family oxidoreductase [Anaerolineae bacterium]
MTRVAVIGVGAMGRNHARVYADLPAAQLVGVADPLESAAAAAAGRYGCPFYTDYHRLLDDLAPDAVTIATPTVHHLPVALDVIGRGIHLLIEKPIAYRLDEAERIIAAAEQANVRLMVGHIERFNPAVQALKRRLLNGELGRVFQIDARRQGPFPARVQDVGVVIDLAVHDLDIMRFITGAEVVRVFAETERRIHSAHEDLLSGLVRLSDGTVGALAINWLTPTKIRELWVTGERGMFRVDYLTQDLYFFENATLSSGDWDTIRVLRGVSEGQMIRYVVPKQEPLQAELQAFLAAVTGQIEVPVTGRDGLKALALARAIVTSGRECRAVRL